MHSIVNSPGPMAQHPTLVMHCRRVLVHSEEARQALLGLGFPGHLPFVTNQGCRDFSGVFADPAAVRAELGIPPGVFAVGFFGFALPHKGIVALSRAVQHLDGVWGLIQAASHFHAPGYIAQIHRELGLPPAAAGEVRHAGRLIFSHRHLSEELVGRNMHAMDAIFLPYGPSTVISSSAAVRTALAAHRPVVTTQVASFSDLTGEVYKMPDASVASIVGTIQHLRAHPGLRDQLAAQARRYSQENGWDVVARRHLELYRQQGCDPRLPPNLRLVYDLHPDAIYDIPIQRERVNWLRQQTQGRSVELGCANGYVTEYCGAALGIDSNPDRLAVARQLRPGYTFSQLDITQPLPFPDRSFDTVLLPEVLQDLDWAVVPRVLAEAARIGRLLLITTPNAAKPGYDKALVENPEHRWFATPEKLEALLAGLPGTTSQVFTSPGQDFVYAVVHVA
jgi:SAM-dependent methyltransferase